MSTPPPSRADRPDAVAGHFDARALLEPVDPAHASAFARAHPSRSGSTGTRIAVGILLGFAVLLVVPMIGVFILGIGFYLGGTGGVIGGLLAALMVTGGIAFGVVMLVRRSIRTRNVARFRLSRFAAANALTYIDRIDAPPLPGMIFSTGTGRMSRDVLRGTQPRFVEFGNYQYTTSNGKSSQTHRWGYVAVKLDVPLPNIVLDALGNNTLGNSIAFGFHRDQRLSLEGDFDRFFALFCPRGYEADALYLFTPDVMARFIDHAAELDVEIVDDWLFLYTRREASTLDPATWAWLFGAVAALLTKLDQWARWRDDRLRLAAAPGIPASPGDPAAAGAPATPGIPSTVSAGLPFSAPADVLTPPPPGVAPPGRRLRRRIPWVVFGILAAVFLLNGIPFATTLFAVLFSR